MKKLSIFKVSKPYLCVATLVAIIVENEFNIEITAEDIAEFYGLNLPLEHTCDIKNVNVSENSIMHGIVLPEDGLNSFFQSKGISFKETYVPINKCADYMLVEEIFKMRNVENYVICGYDYGMLIDKKPNRIGHVSLIIDASPERGTISIYDPGPDNPGVKEVNAEELYYAIQAKKDGLWIVKNTATILNNQCK